MICGYGIDIKPVMIKITFIGAGNVAWHLSQAFFKRGFKIEQVWSRTMASAGALSQLVDAQPIDKFTHLARHDGVFIISLNDEAVPQVIRNLKLPGNLVLHTSGTIEMNILDSISSDNGVLYPLQTFTKGIPLKIQKVPVLIEASSSQQLELIRSLASSISEIVYPANSEVRSKIHVAAVFANNYTNYMYAVASELLAGSGFNLDLLRPLIEETSRKAMEAEPVNLQTGPARRGDIEVIRKHLCLLASKPEYAEIYRLLARQILNKYNPGSTKDAEL